MTKKNKAPTREEIGIKVKDTAVEVISLIKNRCFELFPEDGSSAYLLFSRIVVTVFQYHFGMSINIAQKKIDDDSGTNLP